MPLHTNGEQDGVPAAPEARLLQAPVEQSPQAPQAELQHTPLTQFPEVHWFGVVHAEPLARVAPQDPPTQVFPGEQLALPEHVDGHELAVPSQR